MINARLSQAEIEKNKIDAFNFLQRESRKVYDQIINILKKTETKKPFIQGGFCKKIRDQIYLIEKSKNKLNYFTFYVRYSVNSVWLSISTTYTISDYSRIGSTGQGVEYLSKDVYLCEDNNGNIEFPEGSPDFEEIDLYTYLKLKDERRELQENYEKESTRLNNQIPYILRKGN